MKLNNLDHEEILLLITSHTLYLTQLLFVDLLEPSRSYRKYLLNISLTPLNYPVKQTLLSSLSG